MSRTIWIAKNENGRTTLFTEKPDWVADKNGRKFWQSDKPQSELSESNNAEPAFSLLDGQIIEYIPISNKRYS